VVRRDAYRALVRKPEGKRPLGRRRRRWTMILKRMFKKCDGGTHWIDLLQDREGWGAVVNAVMNVQVT
jgi:hypothetical protein